MRTSGIGFGAGLVQAAAFALFSSGESSIPPPLDAADYAIWISVVVVVGALNGVVVGLVTSWLRPAS